MGATELSGEAAKYSLWRSSSMASEKTSGIQGIYQVETVIHPLYNRNQTLQDDNYGTDMEVIICSKLLFLKSYSKTVVHKKN